MRCLTLPDELAVRGAQPLFISRSLLGHLAELIRGRGHECALLPAPAPDSATTTVGNAEVPANAGLASPFMGHAAYTAASEGIDGARGEGG